MVALVLVAGGINVSNKIRLAQAAQNFTPVQAQQFTLAGSGTGIIGNTIILTKFQLPNGTLLTMSNFGLIGYGTIEPGTSKEEQISFSGVTQNANGTATLTGVTRGISFVYPYTSVAGNIKAHAGGTVFVLSNTAAFYSNFLSGQNDATITSNFIFGSTTPPKYDADPIWGNFSGLSIPDVNYVNNVATSGAANASETVKGIVQLATNLQSASSTNLGSTGARLVIPASLATSSCQVVQFGSNIVSSSTGKLGIGCFDQTLSYTLTGINSFTGTTTFSAPVTHTATTTLATTTVNGLPLNVQWGGNGNLGALSISSGTTTVDLANAETTVLQYTSLSITGTGQLAFINPATTGSQVTIKVQGTTTLTSTAPGIDMRNLGAPGGGANTGGTSAVGQASYPSNVSPGGAAGGAASGSAAGGTGIVQLLNQRSNGGIALMPGSGGGGGNGVGGRGGGALLLEVAGQLTCTGTGVVNAGGANGATGGSTGGGGGGGGGSVVILYNQPSNGAGISCTVVATGGTGGTGNSGAVAGGAGGTALNIGTGSGAGGGSGNVVSGGGVGGGGGAGRGGNGGSGGSSGGSTPSGGGGGGGGSFNIAPNVEFN